MAPSRTNRKGDRMKPEGPAAESVERIFYRANFIRDLDIRLDKVAEGICETSLVVQERLRQQHGFIHGGVIATMADHTAGGAARSVSGDKDVLTVEFKINYLRPAMGDRLRCTATVLRAGKTVIVAEALVYAGAGEKETLVAKLTETLWPSTRLSLPETMWRGKIPARVPNQA